MTLCFTSPNFLVLATLVFLAVPSNQQGLPSCGQSALSRIVGGRESVPNEFPWMVHIQAKYWDGSWSPCGGTLISKDWVLTAAHCLFQVNNATLTLGAHDITNSTSSLRINVDRWSFVAHPRWYAWDVENNIALIRLPFSVSPSVNIQAACLPFANDPDQVNDNVVVTGWGNFSYAAGSGPSPVLRKMNTTVISSLGMSGECQQLASVGPFSGDKIICGDGSLQRHYCYGDDGGPMNFYNQEWNRWFVIGVAGMGDPSLRCFQGIDKPNVFSRVRGYLSWIEGVTGLKPITTTSTTTQSTSTTTKPTSSTTRKPTSTTATEIPATHETTFSTTEPPTTTTTRPSTLPTPTTTTTPPTTTTPSTATPPTTTTITTIKQTTTLGTTPPTTMDPSYLDCKNKQNGNYANPASDCSNTFYMCSNGISYLFKCAQAETVYNRNIDACDWPSNVAGCNNI